MKRANKVRLTEVIKDRLNFTVSPDALFDVQVKRKHENKRNLLNVLHLNTRYHPILAKPKVNRVPRTVIRLT